MCVNPSTFHQVSINFIKSKIIKIMISFPLPKGKADAGSMIAG